MKKSFATLLCLFFITGCGSSEKESQTSLTTSEPEKVAEFVEPAKNVSDEATIIEALEDYSFFIEGIYYSTRFRDDGSTSENDIPRDFLGKFNDVEISDIIPGGRMNGADQVFFNARVANDFFQTANIESFSASYEIGEDSVIFFEDLGMENPENKPLCEPTVTMDMNFLYESGIDGIVIKPNSQGHEYNEPGDPIEKFEFTAENIKDIRIIETGSSSVFSQKLTVDVLLDNNWVARSSLTIDYSPIEDEEFFTDKTRDSQEDYALWKFDTPDDIWFFQTIEE